MPNLAACYFCGVAVEAADAPLDLSADASVTLCPACREKLETVLSALGRPPAESGSGDLDRDPPAPESSEDRTDRTAGSQDTEEPAVDVAGPDADADRGTADGGAATGGADQADTDDTPDDIAAGNHEVSALEYNKVMRLLQNRDFPVERDEFVAVAANAYQVAHADCDRVIDAAIAEGLIDEVEGRLVRPD